MAEMLNPQGFGGRPGRYPPSAENPSAFLASIGRADAPEPPLTVEFVGINDAEQRAAIRGFPGGKRFVLASSPVALLRQS